MNSMHSTGAGSGTHGARRGGAEIFRLFERLLDLLSKLSLCVSGIGMVVLTVIFGWLVFGRYVLNATPTWVEQVALLLVSLIGFVGASSGVHERSHLGVSFFRDVAPRPVQRVMELLTYLIMGGFGLVMMVQTYKLVLFKWSTQIPLIDLPEGLRAVPLTFCGAACLLYSIGHLIRFFREKTPDPRNQS
ncbi:TRAP transporter small permease [Nisaea sp.]|uniref:TRAP transporter small permease n=1 Tax=Nisaea sp. TaxID=2024842 RepID=UPI003B520577